MRPHFTVIVMILCVGLLLLLTRWWQETEYRHKVHGHRTQAINNLRQLSLAMHIYADGHGGSFPPSAIYSKDGKPLLSWRVALLPYIEQEELYKRFHLDEPWDSPRNIKLLPMMPPLFDLFMDHKTRFPHRTFFQVLVGPGTAFEGKRGIAFKDFPDGIGNTFLIVEAAHAVPWTAPEDLEYSPHGRLPALGGHYRDFFLVALADGSVRSVSMKTSAEAIEAAITRNGGQKIRLDDR